MSAEAYQRGQCYKIEAWWPNSQSPPHAQYAAHLADAIDAVIRLAYSGKHTTIRVVTPDSLEVLKMWGQLDGMP